MPEEYRLRLKIL